VTQKGSGLVLETQSNARTVRSCPRCTSREGTYSLVPIHRLEWIVSVSPREAN